MMGVSGNSQKGRKIRMKKTMNVQKESYLKRQIYIVTIMILFKIYYLLMKHLEEKMMLIIKIYII